MTLRRSPLSPMSSKRRAMLAAHGVAHPSSTLVTRTVTKKRPADTGPDAATVDACLERDAWSCVVCGEALHGRRGFDWTVHHRKLRSQCGDNRLSNLICVCGHGTVGCHGDIHAAPAKAQEAGWIVSREDDPAQVLMAHSQRGWGRLTNDGGWRGRR